MVPENVSVSTVGSVDGVVGIELLLLPPQAATTPSVGISSSARRNHRGIEKALLERRTNGKLERKGLRRQQRVVQHAAALRVCRGDETERDVEHRHEEPMLGAGW